MSWDKWNQSALSCFLRSTLILSFHLSLDIPSGLCPSCYPINSHNISLPYHTCYMPHTPPIRSYFTWICNNIWPGTNDEAPHYAFNCLLSASTSSVLGPNIFFSSLSFSTVSLCSSFIVTLHFIPWKSNRQKCNAVYFNLFFFRWKTERKVK